MNNQSSAPNSRNHIKRKDCEKFIINNIIFALDGIHISLNSLEALMDNLIALDFLFANHGGLHTIANMSCCPCINEADKVGQPTLCIQGKLPGSLMWSSCPLECLLMALVGQLGFLVSEYPTGTINCSFFCLSDHNAALLHNVYRFLNASCSQSIIRW